MRKKIQTWLEKMNNMLTKNLVVRKKYIKPWLCFLFGILAVVLVAIIHYQQNLEQDAQKRISSAQALELELKEKVDARERELLASTKRYVEEAKVKPNVILCFDNFADSAYGEIIRMMDKFGFKGVIIFRDGQVPGMKGSISVELYRELLAKGWEGAIGNSESIRVYNNFPEVKRKEWSEYITGMQNSFQEKELEVPSVYIPHKNEIVTGILDLFAKHNLNTYTRLEDDFETAKTEMGFKSFLEMGMVVGKYTYKELVNDITGVVPTAESIAVLYKQVENGAPSNNQHTSVYAFGKQLERLSMLSDFVNVTTFSGYREYHQDIINHNEMVYKNYLIEQSALKNQIASLKAEIAENYAEIFDK